MLPGWEEALSPLAPREVRVVLLSLEEAGGVVGEGSQGVSGGVARRAPVLASRWLRVLSPGERARMARFHFPVDALCHGAGRALLRFLAGSQAGVPPDSLVLAAAEGGKPYLVGHPDLQVNLSHSGTLVAVALTRSGPVGVDVERISPERATLEIARRFFAPAEEEALIALPPERRIDAFFEIWTRKEAFIKATGEGVARGLDTFAVSVGEPAALRVVDGRDPRGRWWMADLEVPRGYRGAVATALEGPAPEFRIVRLGWSPGVTGSTRGGDR